MPATKEKESVSVAQFTIEADHPRNCTLLLQSIIDCRLRSRITASRTITDAKTGAEKIPRDQAIHLGQLPEIPGMHLIVNPDELTYEIYDPLEDDEALCDSILQGLKGDNRPGGQAEKIKGVPRQDGTLDEHRMKTLCLEIITLLKIGHVRMEDGVRPTPKVVEKMKGRELLNPGSRIQNTQPRFKDQWDAWYENLQMNNG